MTTFSKILALVTTAACFAFLGFVLVSLLAGPNWQGMTHELPEYVFTNSGGENPTWTVKKRKDENTTVSTSPVLPKTIVAVYNQIKTEQQATLNVLENGKLGGPAPEMGIKQLDPYLNDPNNGVKALIMKDLAALNAQGDKLQKDLATVAAALEAKTEEITTMSREITKLDLEAKRRREDKYRLQNVVAELKTDRQRAVEHQKQLRDVWERYQGAIQQLQQRNAQLTKLVQERKRLPYESTTAAGT